MNASAANIVTLGLVVQPYTNLRTWKNLWWGMGKLTWNNPWQMLMAGRMGKPMDHVALRYGSSPN